MIYDDLDQFLNKDSITSGVKINSSNVDSIIESGAIPTTSIEGLDETTAGQEAQINQALQDAAEAIADAATAQGTADGKVTTFYADNAPTAEGVGDLWIDTNDNNHLYRWSGSAWVSAKDTSPIVQTLDTRGFTNSLTFSSGGYANIAWTSGTLTFANGNSYYISSGSNTNTTTSPIYIYLDISVPTVLQTTTTASSAVGPNKCLVCVKKTNSDSSKKAIFQVMGGADSGVFIRADNIAANTITANEIAANTITANRLNVSTLSSISADIGTITSGTITGALLQTSNSNYEGIKISGYLGGLVSYGQTFEFRDTSNNLRGYMGADSSKIYIIGVSGYNVQVGSYQDIVLDAGEGWSIRPARTNVDLGDSSYFFRNVHSNRYTLDNTWYYLTRNSGALVFNGLNRITMDGGTFRRVGFTFKDSSGTNRYIEVLATNDPF